MKKKSSVNVISLGQPLKTVSVAYSGPHALLSGSEVDGVIAASTQAMQAEIDALTADFKVSKEVLFEQINTRFEEALSQIKERLPSLVAQMTRRVIPTLDLEVKQVEGIVKEALDQAGDKHEHLDVCLSEKDYNLMNGNGDSVISAFKSVELKMDDSLTPGDCLISSRFGLIDATVESKLEQFERL